MKVPATKLMKIDKYLKIIKSNKSIEFEKLYRDVKSGQLLKKPSFPLLAIIAPLFVSFASLFLTLYQTLFISVPLTEYFALFLLAHGFSFLNAWVLSDSNIDKTLTKKPKYLIH